MNLLKKIYLLVITIICFTFQQVYALSYVYIQGDKQTPFYVKFEEEMMPRYGKNYCIISELAPGPINIEVLFQQNVFPPQKFVINVPENGFRGFLLMKKGGSFSLYDIHRQFYIQAGNTPEDDHIPVNDPSTSFVPTNAPTPAEPVAKPKKAPVFAKTKPAEAKPADDGPHFIDNIELNNERVVQTAPIAEAAGTSKPAVVPGIINSDCPNPLNSDLFDAIYKRNIDKPEKSRLKYLLSRIDQCYNTTQVRLLVKTLPNDPEKYTFLKKVYPRVTDQGAFPLLENVLSTEEWKEYFRLIIPQ